MESLEIIITLMFLAAILIGIAQRVNIAYPFALVLGGGAIGFIPGLPEINFDPNLVLVIVLPPILYYAAFGTSFREFKKNWKAIFSLAIGLVVVTTFLIGLLMKWLFPTFSWALCFAFGAIVSPPDAIAATAILKRFSIGNRLLSILEGESLINDASAIVLYRLAVIAMFTSDFSLPSGIFDFVKIVAGGVFIGALLGFSIQYFSRRFLDPVVGVLFSFTIPYLTFILADFFGFSGVLAVVVNGLIGAKVLAGHHSSLRRILGFAAWDIFSLLLNCFVFILIGLQLRTITQEMTIHQMLLYSFYGLLISFAMCLIRMVWVYAKSIYAYIIALKSPQASIICPQIIQDAAIVGWSGMRGIVSLTAALALPLTLQNDEPLHGRNEVIFITFIVILITLLLPGFTLPALVEWLNIRTHSEHNEARRARKKLAKAAEEKIQHLHSLQYINNEEFEFLSSYFKLQHHVYEISTSLHKKQQNLESARLKVIQEQRKKLLDMWEKLEINDKLLSRLEHELDVEETHAARAELK